MAGLLWAEDHILRRVVPYNILHSAGFPWAGQLFLTPAAHGWQVTNEYVLYNVQLQCCGGSLRVTESCIPALVLRGHRLTHMAITMTFACIWLSVHQAGWDPCEVWLLLSASHLSCWGNFRARPGASCLKTQLALTVHTCPQMSQLNWKLTDILKRPIQWGREG